MHFDERLEANSVDYFGQKLQPGIKRKGIELMSKWNAFMLKNVKLLVLLF